MEKFSEHAGEMFDVLVVVALVGDDEAYTSGKGRRVGLMTAALHFLDQLRLRFSQQDDV